MVCAGRCRPPAVSAPRCRVLRAASPRCAVVAAASSLPGEPAALPSLSVSRAFSIEIPGAEPGRLLEYVTLPAANYNVLDSSAVRRLEDGSFSVSAGKQQFLGLGTFQPFGLVSLKVLAGQGVEQVLSKAELRSTDGKPLSRAAATVNETLASIRLSNCVTATTGAAGELRLRVHLRMSGPLSGVLARVPSDRLNGVMSWTLGLVLPWFLKKLAGDFQAWADGTPRIGAVGSGEMAALAKELLGGAGGKMPKGVMEHLDVGEAGEEGEGVVTPLAPTAVDSGRGRGFGR